MIGIESDRPNDSPSLALLFKWGTEIKHRGMQPDDIADLIQHSFLVAHITRFEEPVARPKNVARLPNRRPRQLKLPFETMNSSETKAKKEAVAPALNVIHGLELIHGLGGPGQFFRLVQKWIDSKRGDLCFFSLSEEALRNFRRELVTGNKPPVRPQEMRFLFKAPQLNAGEHLILVLEKPDEDFIAVHVDNDKLYRNCLTLWHSGFFTGVKPYVVNGITWRHFVALYDRRVEENLYKAVKTQCLAS
jgi:hypothetical protein